MYYNAKVYYTQKIILHVLYVIGIVIGTVQQPQRIQFN